MKLHYVFISLLLYACSSTQKFIEQDGKEEIIFSSDKFSSVDIIQITKKDQGKKVFEIIMEFNHEIKDLGKIFYMTRQDFHNGRVNMKKVFVSNELMLSSLDIYPEESFKLSKDEHALIKEAFKKYPELVNKYKVDVDVLKSYLGWYKLKIL